MAKLTDEELAMMTEAERQGYLDDTLHDDIDEDTPPNNTAEEVSNEQAAQQVAEDAAKAEQDAATDKPKTKDADPAEAAATDADAAAAASQAAKDKAPADPPPVVIQEPAPPADITNDLEDIARQRADIKAQRADIKAQRAEIRRQVNDGDMDYDAGDEQIEALQDQQDQLLNDDYDLREQASELKQRNVKAEVKHEMSHDQMVHQYSQVDVPNWLVKHPEYDDPRNRNYLNDLVVAEQQAAAQRGESGLNIQLVENAHAKFREQFPDTAITAPVVPTPEKGRTIPPTLSHVPASTDDTGMEAADPAFAKLDKLMENGQDEAFQIALGKLSPEKRDEYNSM